MWPDLFSGAPFASFAGAGAGNVDKTQGSGRSTPRNVDKTQYFCEVAVHGRNVEGLFHT